MARARACTVRLTSSEASVLGIEMNIRLRDMNLSLEHAEAYNTVFRAIFQQDHETMNGRRPKSPVRQAMDFQRTGRLS